MRRADFALLGLLVICFLAPTRGESSGVICGPELERPGARIACAQRGHVISAINSAFYGTSDDTTCRREFDLIPSADVIAACRAGAPNYQEAVEADCLGRSACDLRYHPRQGIQDPCPTFTKWAQVDFTCSPATSPAVGPLCDGAAKPVTLSCAPGSVIGSITSAFYGRSDTTTCPDPTAGFLPIELQGSTTSNTECQATGYKAKVEELCVGQPTCTIPAGAVPDPCPGTYTWISIRHQCAAADDVWEDGPFCDTQLPARIECDFHTYISSITAAFYGRDDTTTCPSNNTAQVQNTACSSPGYQAQLQSFCVGEHSCAIGADLLADPCPGTSKYAKVSYTCEAFTDDLIAPEPVCASDGTATGVTLTCPQGQGISYVQSAFYGRADPTICPDASGSPVTTACFTPGFRNEIELRCMERQTCTVPFSVMEDPCPNVSKYAKVSYGCAPRVRCGLKVNVKEGDSCGSIAHAHGLHVLELQQLNYNLDCTQLAPSNVTQLCVDPAALPGGSNGCSPTYRVSLTDTCASIAAANNLTVRLEELNPGLNCMGLVPGQPLCLGTSGDNSDGSDKSGCRPTRRIRTGDTCEKLAADFGMTTFELMVLNPGLDCVNLFEGQGICMGPTGGDVNKDECDHAVQAGSSSCEAIAAAAGITLDRLLQYNEGMNCSVLRPQDLICVSRVGCTCFDGKYTEACCSTTVGDLPNPNAAGTGTSSSTAASLAAATVDEATHTDAAAPTITTTTTTTTTTPAAVASATVAATAEEGPAALKIPSTVTIYSRTSGYMELSVNNNANSLLDGASAGTFTFMVDMANASPDLYAIEYYGSTGATAVHVLTAQSLYTSISLSTPTALPPTSPETFAFALAPNKDIYAIEYTGDSGYTEIYVLSAASDYQSFSWRGPTGLRLSSPKKFQFGVGPNNDLYVIQYADTYTAKVEVQIFTAASRWQTTSLATFTIMDTVPPGAVSFLVDPTWGDIWALRRVSRSRSVEVNVLSKATNCRGFSESNVRTALPSASPNSVVLGLDREHDVVAVVLGGQGGGVPIPEGGCWGTMDECLHGTWLDDGIGLEAHPRTVSGAGTPDLISTANGMDIFSVFSPNSLAHVARANGGAASPCPLVVLSGAEIKEQSTQADAGLGGMINGFLFKSMATANKACKKVAEVLRQDQSYILGAVAFDMANPFAGETDSDKAEQQASFLGNNVGICAALNLCKDTYAFGFQGVSVTFPIAPEPPIEVTLELDYVAYSQDASMLQLPLSRTWKYGGMGTGVFDTGATFESNMLLGGTATLSLGIKTPGPQGKSVATVNLAGEVGIGINLDPANNGLGGTDHGFALSAVVSPSIEIMDKFTLDLKALTQTQIDITWTFIDEDHFSFQASLTRQFTLSGLFEKVDFIKQALKDLIEVTGSASINLYVDQDYAAVFLDLRGDISLLPDLDLPTLEGELGVLLTVGFGSNDTFRVGLVINDRLYCLSVIGRESHTLDTCPEGTVRDPKGSLCYPPCRAGYYMEGFMCHQNCPSGWTDAVYHCTKPDSYGRGAGYAWQFGDWFNLDGAFERCNRNHTQGCEQWGLVVYPKCARGYHNVGCCICSPNCPRGMTDVGVSCRQDGYNNGAGYPMYCQPGEDQELFVCYKACPKGYTGVGPTCWSVC